jgi:sugar lactone lactonase YvrE
MGHAPVATRHVRVLVTGLEGSVGSTIGPDGALYVAEGAAGRVTRVDPRTGATTVFASGLPQRVNPDLGGAMDVAFLHNKAYVLVSLVGSDIGGSDTVGIYRVDGPHNFTVVADIGAYAIAHPPSTDYFVPSGLQFAMQPYLGRFLVTDGHHNRVYRVSTSGHISVVQAFSDIVPTGLEARGHSVYMAEAGPVPHVAKTGKVVRLRLRHHTSQVIASGARLNVDVELGAGHRLYALSQGDFPEGSDPGSPALPNTGALMRVNRDGTMTPAVKRIDRPTSLEFKGSRAFIVTLGGQVLTVRLGHHHDCDR